MKIRITETQTLLIVTKGMVYKVPLSRAAKGWLTRELNNNQRAQTDPFWGSHVVPVTGWCGCLKAKKYLLINRISNPSLAQFITHGLSIISTKPEKPLKELVAYETVQAFLSQHMAVQPRKTISAFLHDARFPASPAHGDFWLGNLMVDQETVLLIDWQNYREPGSLVFDFIHLYVTEACAVRHTRWTAAVFDQEVLSAASLIPCELRSRYFLSGYALSRASFELFQCTALGMLTPHKISKYITLFNQLSDMLCTRNH